MDNAQCWSTMQILKNSQKLEFQQVRTVIQNQHSGAIVIVELHYPTQKGKKRIAINLDSFSSTPSGEQATWQSSKLHSLNKTGILKTVSYNFQLSKAKPVTFVEFQLSTCGRFALRFALLQKILLISVSHRALVVHTGGEWTSSLSVPVDRMAFK